MHSNGKQYCRTSLTPIAWSGKFIIQSNITVLSAVILYSSNTFVSLVQPKGTSSYWLHIRIYLEYIQVASMCWKWLMWSTGKENKIPSSSARNSYTVFRQAFLLIQYSFICRQYFFCSDRNINIFLTDGKQNSWLFQQHFVLVVKIIRKNLLKKWKTTQRWKRSY